MQVRSLPETLLTGGEQLVESHPVKAKLKPNKKPNTSPDIHRCFTESTSVLGSLTVHRKRPEMAAPGGAGVQLNQSKRAVTHQAVRKIILQTSRLVFQGHAPLCRKYCYSVQHENIPERATAFAEKNPFSGKALHTTSLLPGG